MGYLLTIAYDGTNFNGWQAQGKTSLRTVQEEMQKAAFAVFGQEVVLTASGRTDAGVHAVGQTCSFEVQTSIPVEKIPVCFNQHLPPDIRVRECVAVPDDFCACRSAKRKTYIYSFYCSQTENPLLERAAVRIAYPIDFSLLEEALNAMVGQWDFKAFCAAGSSVKTTVRTVYEIKHNILCSMSDIVHNIEVTGNGFLYNMVRTMVGTAIDIAAGRKDLESLRRALEQGDRACVGRTMPAKGLCLYKVEYNTLGK